MRSLRSGILARRSWVCIQCRRISSTPLFNYGRLPPREREAIIPSRPARTRFAPSPTGYLHLGSLRTALFNYLLAKRTGGQFLLRLEDTDQKRTIPDAEKRLYKDLDWAGLNWDEGPVVGGPYGPYRQSERTHIYRKHADYLIHEGHAYRCFCSAERLHTHANYRNEAGLPPGYDRKCAGLSRGESEERAAKGESHVVRLKVDRYPDYEDIVYGTIKQDRPSRKSRNLESFQDAYDPIGRVYDDPILVKSDGHPTYHMANVVDDHLMRITHVVRGTEWMSSTPLHVALYGAFGWKPPRFAHVPLLVDQNGQKLSKRNADIDLSHFRDQGVFPATLLNFAVLLGWSHYQKSDLFSLVQLEKCFTLKFTKGDTKVAFEKLWYLQKGHAQRFVVGNEPEFQGMIVAVLELLKSTKTTKKLSPILQGRPISQYIAHLLKADSSAYTTAFEFFTRNLSFFTPRLDRPKYKPASTPTSTSSPRPMRIPISCLHTAAAAITLVPGEHWDAEILKANIASYDGASAIEAPLEGRNMHPPDGAETETDPARARRAADKEFKKQLYHYLRWALSAGAPGPSIPETMGILGRDVTLLRLDEARKLTQEAGARSPVAERLVRDKQREKAEANKSNRNPSAAGEKKDTSWMGSLAPRK
ncbi:glutamate--tRNA ligase MSE1 [Aspergillus undulatus]|uniref:glutamate--tRNA ligase MSE1 n=1 Tax=Aspergillus undulatus TaxID=1810928 RepID=UPI003CCD5DFA